MVYCTRTLSMYFCHLVGACCVDVLLDVSIVWNCAGSRTRREVLDSFSILGHNMHVVIYITIYQQSSSLRWKECLRRRVWLCVLCLAMPIGLCIGNPGRYSEMQTIVTKRDPCSARRWGVTNSEGETKVTGAGAWVRRLAMPWHLKTTDCYSVQTNTWPWFAFTFV